MTNIRTVRYVVLLGASAVVAMLAVQSHIAGIRAAKLEHVVVPAPYFPPGSVWTKDVSQEPADPHSSNIIGWLSNAGGWGTGKLQVDWNIRVLQATPDTPNVKFRKTETFFAQDSDDIKTFPLPVGGGGEGQSGYQCNIDEADCHILVVDRAAAKLYEAYQANLAGDALTANAIAVWDLNRVYPPSGRGEQCTSADAAGFPIAPLLFNADELASGQINHAIRFTLPNPRIRQGFYVHPASHAGGPTGPDNAPPYGVHFRLKSSFDVSQLKPAAQVVARALQKYGMFLADGGDIALTAQSDKDTVAKYDDVDFGTHDLWSLKVSDFEVVDLGQPIRLTFDCVRNK